MAMPTYHITSNHTYFSIPLALALDYEYHVIIIIYFSIQKQFLTINRNIPAAALHF